MSTSTVQVREFSFPSGELGRGTIICGIVMLLSSRREFIGPGSPAYDYVLAGRPNATKAATWVQNGVFFLLFGAHAVETALFAAKQLRNHGVPVLSAVWLKWMLTCFAGGQFAYKHFDQVVAATAKKV